MADIASLTVEVKSSGVKQTEKELQDLGKTAQKTEGQTDQLAQKAKVLRGGFRAMRGSTQQVSYQLQDIAVQAQMGTDGFRILAQQGPQLASVFGPAGAIAGAFIAFGALLAGVVYNSLTGTTKAMEELEDEANKAAESLGGLTAAERAYQELLITEKIEEQEEALVNLQEQLAGAERKYIDVTHGQKRYTESQEDFEKRQKLLSAQIEIGSQKLETLQGVLVGTDKDTTSLISRLGEESEALVLNARQIDLITAARANATPEQLAEIDRLHDLIDANRAKNEADKQSERQQEASAQALIKFEERLDNQHQLLTLTGDELYRYQAAQAGATGADVDAVAEKIRLNAELREQQRLDRQAAAEKKAAADREARLIERETQNAEERLQAALRSNKSEIESIKLRLGDKLALLEQDRIAALAKAEQEGRDIEAINLEYANARVQLEESTESQIAGIKQRYRDEEERKREEEQRELEEQNRIRLDSQRNVTDSLLAFEDMLLQGKSESARLGATMAINFANEEKRANAQQIISDSYGAAMKAYKALAGIPVVGPALGAAAAGTIITAGAAYATQSLAGRATGGQVRGGQSYLVGERGPELLTMGGSGRISSNDQLKQAVGGGGGITVINNVDARGADASVDQKIRLAMKQTSESTTRNIQNLMKRRRFV
jgi:hypothetical protein